MFISNLFCIIINYFFCLFHSSTLINTQVHDHISVRIVLKHLQAQAIVSHIVNECIPKRLSVTGNVLHK